MNSLASYGDVFHQPEINEFRALWDALGSDDEAKKSLVAEKAASAQLVWEVRSTLSPFRTEFDHHVVRKEVQSLELGPG